MLLQVYFALSLMYMPSFIAVSVVVFKLLPVKSVATHIFEFFPLCKLKILPTLRPCNFKSKSQSCLEKNKCKDCDKPCSEIHWESCHCHVTHCVVSKVLFHANWPARNCFSEQLQPSASVSSFFADHMI